MCNLLFLEHFLDYWSLLLDLLQISSLVGLIIFFVNLRKW